MMTRKLIVILLNMVIVCGTARAGEISVNLSADTALNRSIKSLLVPGWGQFSKQQNKKGAIIAAGAFASAAASVYFYIKADNTYKDYKSLGVRDDSLYSTYQDQSLIAANASYVAAAFWLYGIVDALRSNRGKYSQGKSIKVLCGHDGIMQVVYQKKF